MRALLPVDLGFDKFNIACEDTLISPQHWDDEPFELIVSNPPYSIKWAGDENHVTGGRLKAALLYLL